MNIDRSGFIELLESSYARNYNIIEDDPAFPEDLPVAFRAEYFQRDEKYWLSKKIHIYVNETNEYVYVFSAPSFDESLAQRCIQFALDDGLPRVQPHKEHQYTNVKALFVYESFTPEAVKSVRKRRLHQEYHHGFWGYTDLLLCGVNPQTEEVFVNRAGNPMKAYFRKLFSAQRKKLKSCSQIN